MCDIVSYLLGKKKGGGGTEYNLQDTKSVTITSNTTTEVTPDTGYDAVKKVQVTTNVQPNLESKSVTITENGTTTITPTSGKDGMSQVEVTTNVAVDLSNYFESAIPTGTSAVSGFAKMIKSIPETTTAGANDLSYAFAHFEGVSIPLIDTSTATNMSNMFYACPNITTIPLFNTPKVTKMKNMFNSCQRLVSIPAINTERVTDFSSVFSGCLALTTVPVFDWNKVTTLTNAFFGCTSLSNDSVDNILQSCISATSYNSTKQLIMLGFSETYFPSATIQALPHYQDFINAGWTIGY